MDMDERWVNRPPEVMLETFHGFQGEGFDLVLDDLLALPPDPPVLAEGFSLLPRLVAPLLSRPRQAVWLLPTPEFRRAAFESRGSTWTIPNRTSDPQRALANLLARDQLFTEELRAQARASRLQTIDVDGSVDVAESVARVGEGAGGFVRPSSHAERVDVVFPDGTVVRASSIGDRVEHDPTRSFGLYLDMRWLPTWPAEVVEWQDYGLPADGDRAADQITAAFARARRGDVVEVGCVGGLGRTGTVLACMAVLAGEPRRPPWIGSGVSTSRPRSRPAPRSSGCGGSPAGWRATAEGTRAFGMIGGHAL